MPNVNEIPLLVGAQVVQTVRKAEDVAVEAVKSWAETVGRIVPELKLPVAEQLPNAREAVVAAFAVAQQAVEAQRDFVLRVLDSVEERLNLDLEEEAKPAPRTSAKTAAAEAAEESAGA